MRLPTDRDLQRFRGPIATVLRRQRESQAVRWAEGLVQRDLFQYRATTSLTVDLFTQRVLTTLGALGATPLDVLQRVVECAALRRDGEPTLDHPRAYRVFLARSVLRIKRGTMARGRHARRPNAHHTAYVGEYIDGVLGRFAAAVLLQCDKAAEEARAFKGACEDLAAGTVTRIRHGRNTRTLTGKRRSHSRTPKTPVTP